MPINRLGQSEFNSLIPFTTTTEGDIDMCERRIRNLASAEAYNDAITLEDCWETIEEYIDESGIVKRKDYNGIRVYDFGNSRLCNLNFPSDDNDAVTLAYARSMLKTKFEEYANSIKKHMNEFIDSIEQMIDSKIKKNLNMATDISTIPEKSSEL